MKINLKINTLKAAAMCAAKNEIRIFLNGVCIDIKNDSQLVVIGTNGYIAFIGVENYEGEWGGKPEQIIIPIDAINAALKNRDKKIDYIVLEKINTEKMSLGNVLFNPIDANYPDYARAIPKVKSVKTGIGHYPHEYLKILDIALEEASGDRCPIFHQHGENDAGVFTCYMPNYICLVMPINKRDEAGAIPLYKGIELPK